MCIYLKYCKSFIDILNAALPLSEFIVFHVIPLDALHSTLCKINLKGIVGNKPRGGSSDYMWQHMDMFQTIKSFTDMSYVAKLET